MRMTFFVVPGLLLAGVPFAQSGGPADAANVQAKVPPVEYRSAFQGYRTFADQDLRDWRKSNEEVGVAGGHAGHYPGQGPARPMSKPQPGKPESAGGPREKSTGAPSHQGYGGHK